MQIVIDIPDEEFELNKWLADNGIGSPAINRILNGTPLPKCKDCRHFETDVVATVDGIPLIVGHECCTKWGDGCKTKEDGYCFMFEDKEVEDD